MNQVLVIHEIDYTNQKQSVIGVADSTENAEKIIKEYYGDFKEISYTDIRDSNLQYSKVLEVMDHLNEPYRVQITLEWFEVNVL